MKKVWFSAAHRCDERSPTFTLLVQNVRLRIIVSDLLAAAALLAV